MNEKCFWGKMVKRKFIRGIARGGSNIHIKWIKSFINHVFLCSKFFCEYFSFGGKIVNGKQWTCFMFILPLRSIQELRAKLNPTLLVSRITIKGASINCLTIGNFATNFLMNFHLENLRSFSTILITDIKLVSVV